MEQPEEEEKYFFKTFTPKKKGAAVAVWFK